MANEIPNVNRSGFDPETQEKLNSSNIEQKLAESGIGDAPLKEPVPEYIPLGGDKVYKGANNTWIVLSRDRPNNRLSGYAAHTQAGAIDIVVGRMGLNPKSKTYVDPNFETDSARIYISQKTDIDKNFSLVPGRIGDSRTNSGIAIKADGVRIIGRKGIKLVTEQNDVANFGIDIIANNDDSDLQPMVKGNNLTEALNKIIDNVQELSGIVSTILTAQMDYNIAIASHFHYSPFYGMPTTPSDQLMSEGIDTSVKHLTDGILNGLVQIRTNFISTKNNYLRPSGAKYINSLYNNLN